MMTIANRLRGTMACSQWLDFNSGWTLGEGIVGLTQDIAFIGGIYYVMAH